MPCDSLRLLDFDLARRIQSLGPEETVETVRSRARAGELPLFAAAGMTDSELDATIESQRKHHGPRFVSELKSRLLFGLCLSRDEAMYPNPPYDAIDDEEWNQLPSHGDLIGDEGENLFLVLTWQQASRLLEAFEANADSNPYFAPERVEAIERLIDACKANASLRIAYMIDF